MIKSGSLQSHLVQCPKGKVWLYGWYHTSPLFLCMDSLNITLSVLINYTLQALSSHLFVEIIIMIIPVMYRSLSLLSVHFTDYWPNQVLCNSFFVSTLYRAEQSLYTRNVLRFWGENGVKFWLAMKVMGLCFSFHVMALTLILCSILHSLYLWHVSLGRSTRSALGIKAL